MALERLKYDSADLIHERGGQGAQTRFETVDEVGCERVFAHNGGLNQRRGTIVDSEVREDEFTAIAEVALNDMFGYSSHLRGITQGKGEFSMEYKMHQPVLPQVQAELEAAYKKSLGQVKK